MCEEANRYYAESTRRRSSAADLLQNCCQYEANVIGETICIVKEHIT